MSTLQIILSAANHNVGLTNSMLDIYAPNDEYVVISFNAVVRKGINASVRYDCDIKTMFDKNNEESYMSLLNEIADIFHSLQYHQHAAIDFIEWRKGYNNAIRKHMYKKPSLVDGTIEARQVDMAGIFAGLTNDIKNNSVDGYNEISIHLRGTKEIGIETNRQVPGTSNNGLIWEANKSKITIPFKIEDTKDFYTELLNRLDVCIQRTTTDFRITMLYKQLRNGLCRHINQVSGCTIYTDTYPNQ